MGRWAGLLLAPGETCRGAEITYEALVIPGCPAWREARFRRIDFPPSSVEGTTLCLRMTSAMKERFHTPHKSMRPYLFIPLITVSPALHIYTYCSHDHDRQAPAVMETTWTDAT